MTPDFVLDVMQRATWVSIEVAGPLLALGVGVGLLMGLVQAATQLSEPALTFVPKLAALGAGLFLFGSFVIERLTALGTEMLSLVGTLDGGVVQQPELAAFVPLLLPWAAAVVLAGARAAGFVLGLPHTTGAGIPKAIQAMVVLALAVAMVGARPGGVSAPTSIGALAVGVGLEFVFGLLLGFLIQLALAAVRVAGELVGIEMGLSFAAVADPLSSGQSTALSSMFMQMGIALFLALGLDRVAIAALVRSIDRHPLGAATIDPGSLGHVVGLADGLVGAAFGFALPLVGALLCLKLALAMLARVAPKLQIFTLAFGLAIGVGLLLLALLLPSMASAIAAHLQRMTGVLVELAVAG